MADVQMIPAPPPPVGTARSRVKAKEGTPSPADQKYYASKLANRGVRADFALPDEPTMEEQRLSGLVQQLFSTARTHRRSRVQEWRRWDQLLENRTWLGGRPAYLPAPEVPELYSILATVVAYVTDARPSAEFAPAALPGSSNFDFWQEICWDLQTVTESVMHADRTEKQFERLAWDAYTYGTGILKSTWDQALDGGLGNVSISRVNPYNFYPDPAASDETDGSYYIEVRSMSMQELDRRFPGSARKLMPVSIGHDDPYDPDSPRPTLPRANPGAITGTSHLGQAAPSTSPNYGLPGQARETSPIDDTEVTVIEAWIRQHEHVEAVSEDQFIPKSTVETWRCVVVVGNRVLLDCDASDLYGHPDHPYSRFVHHETRGAFWGQSMVGLLASLQLSLNRAYAAIQHNLDLHGNPVLKETARANIDRTMITNRPGQRLRIGDGGDVEWLQPPPIHPLHLEMIQQYIGEMERISGLNAIARGGTPTGRNSSDVMNAVQESGFVRIRMALRNLEYTCRNAFTKAGQLIVSNYTIPRVIAIVGESGERTSLAIRSRHFTMPSGNGAIPLRFQILVNAGAGLPISRSAQLEEANFLFSVNAIDRQALLQAHRFPNWRQIEERMMMLDQAGLAAMQETGQRQATR